MRNQISDKRKAENLFNRRKLYMIDRETIKAAKAVDINIIFEEFNWEKDRYSLIPKMHSSVYCHYGWGVGI